MDKLIASKQVTTSGVADDTAKTSFVEHRFTTPTNILVQALLTASTFNRQQTSFWKVELTVDSWESRETGVNVVHTIPPFSIANPIEIKKCNWVKVRLTAVNGSGSGIMNIYV
jgi:hypothetical protein